MSKDNILFGIIGLLAGLIIGFMFANSVNRNGFLAAPTASTAANSALPPGHPDLGNGASDQQQSQMGAPEVQAAIEKARKEPNNFDAQINAAKLYYQIQRFDGAIEFYQHANQLKPDDYETIVQLGNANFDGEKFDEAEKWYTQALSKKPDDVDVRTDLGLTFMFRQPPNYDRAIQEFKHSLETNPKHPQTLQNLVVAYTKKGDIDKANSTLDQLQSVDAQNPAISKLRDDIRNAGIR